jgi:hypothetical protein
VRAGILECVSRKRAFLAGIRPRWRVGLFGVALFAAAIAVGVHVATAAAG